MLLSIVIFLAFQAQPKLSARAWVDSCQKQYEKTNNAAQAYGCFDLPAKEGYAPALLWLARLKSDSKPEMYFWARLAAKQADPRDDMTLTGAKAIIGMAMVQLTDEQLGRQERLVFSWKPSTAQR